MEKRVAITTIGTLGDVQPYVALAMSFKKRGHSVVLGAPSDFENLIKSHDIEFHSLGTSIQAYLTQSRFEKAMKKNLFLHAPLLMLEAQKIFYKAMGHCHQMAQGADVIVANMNTSFAIDIAEALKIPVVMSAAQPLTSTGDHPLCIYNGPSLGRILNRFTYGTMQFQQSCYNPPRNKGRRDFLGLPSLKNGKFLRTNSGEKVPILYAYSEKISPRPTDWPDNAHITGYWRMDEATDWQPSDEFKDFLAQGSAPIYIGFGSMPFGAERNTQLLNQALHRWGGRAVVARGWGGIHPEDLHENVFAIGHVPHDQLFKHVQAVVHHGGAGTTSTGLHSARPTFVIPQAVDQRFWGRKVAALGCGPDPISIKKITPETLASALEDLTHNQGYHLSSQAVSRLLKAESGKDRAVDFIENLLGYRASKKEKAS